MKNFRVYLLSMLVAMQVFTMTAAAEELPRFSMNSAQLNSRLSSTIAAMAKQCGLDIVFNPKADGPVLATFTDKTLPEAMDLLADSHNFNWKIENNTVVVGPAEIMTQKKHFILRYASPATLKEQLKSIIPEKSITTSIENSSVTIDATRPLIKKAEEMVREIDVPSQLILVQAQYVEISNTDTIDLGFQHSWGGYDNKTFNKNLQYAVTANAKDIISKGKIVASPSIITTNGLKAELKAGVKVPVLIDTVADNGTKSTTVDYKDVGYFLEATPRVSGENGNMITMSLHPESSAITGWVSNGNTKAPQMAKREANTNVRVTSGDTIIIGGLVRDEEIANLEHVPGISSIPILGALFKNRHSSKEKSQVFIFVTPTIVNEKGIPVSVADKETKELNEAITKLLKNQPDISSADKPAA